MASTQVLKSRIRSVTSTRQITKAMQLVAASKMRRAQEATKVSAPYTQAARELLAALSTHASTKGHPLFVERPVKSRLLIVIASDKGLAGAYNSNVAKLYVHELKKDDEAGIQNKTITVGRKASQFAARLKDTEVLGSYQEMPDRPDGSEIRAILDSAKTLFTSGEVDAVDVLYTEFVNSITQTATVTRLLPAGGDMPTEKAGAQDVIY